MKQPHGNTGKQNALRGKAPLDARIAIRITSEARQQAQAAADAQGIKLSQWFAQAIAEKLGRS